MSKRRRRGERGYALSDATQDGQHVRIRCTTCWTMRVFDPKDLNHLFGDIDVSAVRHRMKCGSCGPGTYLDVDVRLFSAEERSRLTVRRIAEVYHVKRVRWRDERP